MVDVLSGELGSKIVANDGRAAADCRPGVMSGEVGDLILDWSFESRIKHGRDERLGDEQEPQLVSCEAQQASLPRRLASAADSAPKRLSMWLSANWRVRVLEGQK